MKNFTLVIVFTLAVVTSFAQWNPNGSGIYYDGGNVGIGTQTPEGKLHINSTGSSRYFTYQVINLL